MAIKLRLAVEMEDGSTYEAVADQRDLMRYEIQPFAGPVETHGHTFTRFVAFSALDRAGALKGKNNKSMGWEAFNNACVEVHDAQDVDEDLENK